MAFRINPTIFDKLAASHGPRALADPTQERQSSVGARGGHTHVDGFSEGVLRLNLDSFGESALRANVRRELGWLLNTTNLESTIDLSRYPRVRASVLNYGVADLAGKALSRSAVTARAGRIREAIKTFEPRIDEATLSVEVISASDRENAVTYVISGDATSAIGALHVQYYTDVEADTGNTEVRE